MVWLSRVISRSAIAKAFVTAGVVMSAMLLCLPVRTLASLEPAESRVAHARRAMIPPVIDGSLEPLWYQADPVTGFIQYEPREGDSPTYTTTVYILYDTEALYLGFSCEDAWPDSISRRVRKRDDVGRADRVYINLDTFRDRRNGYYFGVTAAGVQADGTISNENDFDGTWDAVWSSEVSVHDSGWVAEMKIPFQILRHGGAMPEGWGLNLTRYVYRLGEVASWIPLSRQAGPQVSRFGRLTGLKDIAFQMYAEVLPHAVARWDARGYDAEDNTEAGPWHSVNDWDNLGFDLKWVPDPKFVVDLTVLPDFAQVDVDREVINLSDYPVFLTEKRPFFLEGKQIFDSSPVQVLYTRRIADPDLGARVTTQQGRFRGAALTARNHDEEGDPQLVGASRLIYNLGRNSMLGYTFTHLNEEGYQATVNSSDGRIRWGRENSLTWSVSAVDRDGPKHQPINAQSTVNIGYERWDLSYNWGFRGRDADMNDLGWTNYTDQTWHWANVHYNLYPRSGMFELWRFRLSGYQESMTDLSHPFGNGQLSMNWRFRNYWGGSAGATQGSHWRRVYADGEEGEVGQYRDNFGTYDPVHYESNNYWLELYSDARQPLEGVLTASRGSHRDGERVASSQSLLYKPSGMLEWNAWHNWNRVWDVSDVNDGFTTDYHIVGLSLRWHPHLNITLRSTIQYTFSDDWYEQAGGRYTAALSERLLSNLMLAWNYRPKSWFYLVYDDRREEVLLDPDRPGDRTLRAKWTWFFVVP
ncbi:hypothetical protein GF324_09195 [bacterium]|nr:hypothetical protein [bacterium]